MSIFSKIKNRVRRLFGANLNTDTFYKISGDLRSIVITLPEGHKLPHNQLLYKLYDKKLVEIATLINKEVGGTCIDIGANIGDTAVAIRTSTNMPLICVEGDKDFYAYLEKNTKDLEKITLVKSFIGREKKELSGVYVKKEGTGKIIQAENTDNVVSFISFDDLLTRLHLNPSDVSLLKIDTDGFDFDILLGSLNFINNSKTSLFFEYEVNSHESQLKSLEVISKLSSLGYKFILYDNYGNFFSTITSDFLNRFNEVNAYIKSGNSNGGGICYVDVFAAKNTTIFDKVYKGELITF